MSNYRSSRVDQAPADVDEVFQGFNQRMRRENAEKLAQGLDAPDSVMMNSGVDATSKKLDLFAGLGDSNPMKSLKNSMGAKMKEIAEKKNLTERQHIDRLKYMQMLKTGKYGVK